MLGWGPGCNKLLLTELGLKNKTVGLFLSAPLKLNTSPCGAKRRKAPLGQSLPEKPVPAGSLLPLAPSLPAATPHTMKPSFTGTSQAAGTLDTCSWLFCSTSRLLDTCGVQPKGAQTPLSWRGWALPSAIRKGQESTGERYRHGQKVRHTHLEKK